MKLRPQAAFVAAASTMLVPTPANAAAGDLRSKQ